MAAAPGSAAVAELIGANGGRWVSSAGGAFAVQGGNVVDMRDGSVIATLRPAVGAPSMLMQNVAVEVRNVPYFGEITDYRPAWVVDAARSSERQVTWVGERTHREIDPPDEITWTPLVRALPAPRGGGWTPRPPRPPPSPRNVDPAPAPPTAVPSERVRTWTRRPSHTPRSPRNVDPAPAPPTHPALTPRLAARAVGSVRRRDHRAIAPPPSRPLHPPSRSSGAMPAPHFFLSGRRRHHHHQFAAISSPSRVPLLFFPTSPGRGLLPRVLSSRTDPVPPICHTSTALPTSSMSIPAGALFPRAAFSEPLHPCSTDKKHLPLLIPSHDPFARGLRSPPLTSRCSTPRGSPPAGAPSACSCRRWRRGARRPPRSPRRPSRRRRRGGGAPAGRRA